MTLKLQQNSALNEDCRLLASLLEVESRQYRRLLRLAWRQNSYMKRQDVDRLDSNAREWAKYLPLADEARIARERFIQELAQEKGMASPPVKMDALLSGTCSTTQFEVREAVNDLRAVSVRLERQNELNRQLAEFCLDLAKEEAEIFRSTVLSDPSGCYGNNAQSASRGPGGVLVRQA